MGTMMNAVKMGRAAGAAIEAGLPKPATPKPETKPATPKADAKSATKKAAPAKPKLTVRTSASDDTAITVKKSEHTLTGKRGKAIDIVLKAGTVGKAKAALAKAEMRGYYGWAVRTATGLGLISVRQ